MRTFRDASGGRWAAEVVSHGRTSGYLNPKVHRPVVQFTRLDGPGPRRYAGLPRGRNGVEDLAEDELVTLLGKAEVH